MLNYFCVHKDIFREDKELIILGDIKYYTQYLSERASPATDLRKAQKTKRASSVDPVKQV